MISYCQHRHSNPDPNAPALDIQGLSAGYPGEDRPALSHVNLRVPVGAAMALVGSNGAGKSTLFKTVSGLLPAKAGQVRIFGHRLGECHHRVVYLPQRSDIDWHFPMSVMDLALTGRYVYMGWLKRPTQKDVDITRDALKQLAVDDLADRQINKLSGGQQQRVLIARAVAQNADLLLLDEPLNAVDVQTRDIVAKVLDGIKAAGKTVIVATHYYDQEEGRFDGAIYLKDGEQVRTETAKHPQDGCQHDHKRDPKHDHKHGEHGHEGCNHDH